MATEGRDPGRRFALLVAANAVVAIAGYGGYVLYPRSIFPRNRRQPVALSPDAAPRRLAANSQRGIVRSDCTKGVLNEAH